MAANYILDVDGVKGESQVKNYENKIEVHSFSWHGSQLGTWHEGGGGGGGKANVGDLAFTKTMDKSSSTLFQKCMIGSHIPQAKLSCLRVSGAEPFVYLEIIMKKVIVSSISWGGGGELPTESITFNFATVEWEYKIQTETGGGGEGIRNKWNVPLNAEG